MVLECDQKAKKEIIKFIRETRHVNGLLVGNVSLKRRKEILEKSVSEVIKYKDININCEEHM